MEKVITKDDEKRLRRHLWLLAIGSAIVFVATFFFPVSVSDKGLVCESSQTQLAFYLFTSTLACLDVSVARLAIYAVLTLIAIYMAAASVAEHGWGGLCKAIFTPDGNNAPAWTTLFYLAFLFATAANVRFTDWPNFFLATAYYISRNILLGIVVNWVVIRLLKIKTVNAYLREQITPFSDGLPIAQAVALLIAFYFPRVFGG
jgi:hypothetical protein